MSVSTRRSRAPLRVIAHEATRTGGPVVLLELLRRAKPHLDRPVEVHLLAEGPLAGDLRSLDDGVVTARPSRVLVNSALGAAALVGLDPSIPRAVYVHEVGEALRTLDPDTLGALRRADLLLAVTAEARDDLVALGVPRERVALLPPLVPEPGAPAIPTEQTRDSLGLPDGVPLVLGCGVADWRKGADLFVDVCRRMMRTREVQAVWVGRRPRTFARLLDGDTALAGLTDGLRWHGEVPDARPLLAAADVLLMTSREDPQPLVPMEAALLGTATAGFAVGGLRRMAAAGGARAVAYPDTAALSAAALELLDHGGATRATAGAGAAWVREHHGEGTVVPEFVAAMDGLRTRAGGDAP